MAGRCGVREAIAGGTGGVPPLSGAVPAIAAGFATTGCSAATSAAAPAISPASAGAAATGCATLASIALVAALAPTAVGAALAPAATVALARVWLRRSSGAVCLRGVLSVDPIVALLAPGAAVIGCATLAPIALDATLAPIAVGAAVAPAATVGAAVAASRMLLMRGWGSGAVGLCGVLSVDPRIALLAPADEPFVITRGVAASWQAVPGGSYTGVAPTGGSWPPGSGMGRLDSRLSAKACIPQIRRSLDSQLSAKACIPLIRLIRRLSFIICSMPIGK